MAQPRRIAVTEVNHWHSTYDAAYLKILTELKLEIVGVSDANLSIAEDRARQFGTKAFQDYRALVESTRPDFVIALGRHIDMPEIARFLIDRGVPFLMEKPMGTEAATVAGLADLVERSGAWVAVPFPNRYSPFAVKAKEMVAAGAFGAVSHLTIRLIRPTMDRYKVWDSPWMWDRKLAGGGALTNLGGHGMDLVPYVTGQPVRVASAVISNVVHAAEVEDYALATLRTAGGILAHVEVGYTMPTWPQNSSDIEMKVAGAKCLLRVVPAGLHILAPDRDEIIPTPMTATSSYFAFVQDCLARVGAGQPPAISARDCANAVALIHDAYHLAGRV
ncbi:MAG: Gfo/Idh/MocA family oxidoreductase [Actinobacteria bacterium]|nr:Gfo/Idh/MocA family oxidoreductase [Actinomycetota bacterium]